MRPGETFDRYTIEELLGEGGMGSVYRAYDSKLHRYVALKLLRTVEADATKGSGAQGAARMLREARAAAALTHANAVAIFDVGEHEGNPYIAMELVPGKPLRAYVGDETVSVAHRVRWLRDVARALAAAHDRGLVHRDIKPENVMIRDDDVVKVLDFGIAQKTASVKGRAIPTDAAGLATLTREGALIGTPLYMAPEQLRGERLDGRADQFAWGVLAYELLSGHPPWRGDRRSHRLLAEILTQDPEPLSSATRDVPTHVERVVMRALSKALADRFATMEDLLLEFDPSRDSAEARRPRLAGEPAPARRATSTPAPNTVTGGVTETPERPLGLARTARSTRGRTLAAVAAVVLAFAGVSAWAVRVSTARAPVAVTSASGSASQAPLASSAAAKPTAITDHPPPETSSSEASTAYLAGLQAVRDASVMRAAGHFARAAAADPALAAAHLRMALYAGGLVETEGRRHLLIAVELRGKLTERDRGFLDAVAPAWLTLPPDDAESRRRFGALLARSPGDLETRWLAMEQDPDRRSQIAACARMLAEDPKFAAAAWMKASLESELGDIDAASTSLDQCLAITPSAASCLRIRAMIHQGRGECAAMEEDSRGMVAVERDGYKAYDFLARSLVARAHSFEAVHEALAQKWALTPLGTRTQVRLTDEARLAILGGDFAAAKARANELAQSLASVASESVHAAAARLLVDIESETGHIDRAARIAASYLATRGAWNEDFDYPRENARPFFVAAAARGGLRTAEEQRLLRKEWIDEYSETSGDVSVDVWLGAFAIPASTAEAAREALGAMPPDATAKRVRLSYEQYDLGALGKTLLLAGRVDEALPFVELAAASCGALNAPIDHTMALYRLGLAREAKKDTSGACVAYARVLERWGKARPRSVTAERARDHVAALHCAP